MKKTKITNIRACSLMALLALLACSLVGCTKEQRGDAAFQPTDPADAVVHTDYTSVYERIGSEITIDMVEERDGLAYVTYGGVEYELGMDFLSMAMVYNTSVPANDEVYRTAEDVFNQWWKLYIQRWNYLVPEVPLYSNQYFDLYNAKIENFSTTPYWGAADAIVAATVRSGYENSVILGSSTQLSGAFRNSSWGKSSPAASDLDIESLTSGHATVMTDRNGALIWNMAALAETPVLVKNADGTLTYTIRIKRNLKFSDGSAITAQNYLASLLANSTPVSEAAGGSGNSGMTLKGFEAFNAYNGKNNGADVDGVRASQYFEGVRLIDSYTFAVTFAAEYADYYYTMSYASFSPVPTALYLGAKGAIVTNEKGVCGLNDAFYQTEKREGVDTYTVASEMIQNLKWSSDLPYSGPYVVAKFDESSLVATLTLNPYYPGDDARGTASIARITYVEIVSETQMDMFTTGRVDVIEGITGGTVTERALRIVKSKPDQYAESHYDRAGYGKLAFRCDLGPTSFASVRQAIIYTINRPEFAQTFTGGYGTVVHGPYYAGYSAYRAVGNEILLNEYTYSLGSARRVLEEDGWIYNADGSPYDAAKGGVRYKKLSGYELSPDNISFATTDGKYRTVKVNGAYYMPLAINWYGTQPNEVTDLLITSWRSAPAATEKIGMYITYTSSEFASAVYGDYSQMREYGWNGTALCNAVNFATGFNSAIYDVAWSFTIDPELYDHYSGNYLMDEADFWENYGADAPAS